MSTSQTMNKFQPYAKSMPKLPKFPKFPKFPKLKNKLKTKCHFKDKKQKDESSSSSEDERFHNLTKAYKPKKYDLLNYNPSSECEDCCNEKYDKKICYPKYQKLKQVVCQDGMKKKSNQQCNVIHDDICNSREIHHNKIQPYNAKDCCWSIKNDCMQCEHPQHNIKDCCSSPKSDCTPRYCTQSEATNNFKTHYNDDVACNSCCEHNESYNHYNCLPDIGSSINHYRSNNLLTNSHLLPRRYPPSWTPLHNRSPSPPKRVARNVCTIKECNDHKAVNDEFYEGNCNAIRGGVGKKSPQSYSQTSEVSSYLCKKCGNYIDFHSSNNCK